MQSIELTSSNFKYLIENDCLFVDKSLFIEDVLKGKQQVNLFLRPRRFGKSLNLSMLKYFFSIEGADKNKTLFKSLKIENSPYFSEQGKYPVIYLDMKVLGSTYKDLTRKLNIKVREIFQAYETIILQSDKLTPSLKNDCNKILNDEEFYADDAIKFLCKSLYKIYGQKVVVLIDEYDAPLVEAYKYDYYEDALPLLKNFYSTLLKSNEYIRLAAVFGIVRLSQTSIFSGLNNLREYNILLSSFDEYFGFTEDEVLDLLKKYQLGANLEDIKAYYDGYKFGDIHVYNPWSILNYIDLKVLDSYWVNTAENYLIKELFNKATDDIVTKLELLLKGETIEETIQLTSSLAEQLDITDIWSQLLFAGYLTLDDTQDISLNDEKKKIRIPNKEVYKDFIRLIKNILS